MEGGMGMWNWGDFKNCLVGFTNFCQNTEGGDVKLDFPGDSAIEL